MTDGFGDRYRTWHTRLSYAKSAVRLAGCAMALLWQEHAVVMLAASLGIAEVLGILEEWI